MCTGLRACILPIAKAQLTCSNLLSGGNLMACIVSSEDKLAKCFKATAPNFSLLSTFCVSQKAALIFVIFIFLIKNCYTQGFCWLLWMACKVIQRAWQAQEPLPQSTWCCSSFKRRWWELSCSIHSGFCKILCDNF